MTVRVRYAPSPTGHLHVGSLRTALYNFLYARHNKGTYLLRIEDTDTERSLPEYTASILESLTWASLEPDEAPMIQSDRADVHREVSQKLLAEGKAYKCYCTVEELHERLGPSAAHEGGYTRYDGFCRNGALQEGKSYAIRFKIPHDEVFIEFTDLIRGVIRFERELYDDFIIVRSDGAPTYNFVVVVDDAFMSITHVLRGEDHISNTPRQVFLYRACGYTLPAFAHFSLILGPDGQRLSKRHMATSVAEFKAEGFLAHALCNYLVRLGWSHGDQEVFTREELIEFFTLDSMNRAGAIFDKQKLEWMNGLYIRELSNEEICTFSERDVDPQFKSYFSNWSSQTLMAMIGLYKERVKTLKELILELRALHERPQSFPHEVSDLDTESLITNLQSVQDALSRLEDHSPEAVDVLLKAFCKDTGITLKQIGQPLRVALTGKIASPGFAKLISLLSVDESIERIGFFVKHLKRSMKH